MFCILSLLLTRPILCPMIENIPGMLGWIGILGGQVRSMFVVNPRALTRSSRGRFHKGVQLVENKLQVFRAQRVFLHMIQT